MKSNSIVFGSFDSFFEGHLMQKSHYFYLNNVTRETAEV